MKKTEEKSSRSAEGLYKFFIYFVLILLAVTIIVPCLLYTSDAADE